MDDDIFGYDPGYDYNMDGHLDELESLMQYSDDDDNLDSAKSDSSYCSSFEHDEYEDENDFDADSDSDGYIAGGYSNFAIITDPEYIKKCQAENRERKRRKKIEEQRIEAEKKRKEENEQIKMTFWAVLLMIVGIPLFILVGYSIFNLIGLIIDSIFWVIVIIILCISALKYGIITFLCIYFITNKVFKHEKAIRLICMALLAVALIAGIILGICEHNENERLYQALYDHTYEINSYHADYEDNSDSDYTTESYASTTTRATTKHYYGSYTSPKTSSDPFDASEYGFAEDFYDDHYDDFYDYEDAEDYWDEYN